MTMALKGGSPGQAAAVLQSLVLNVLVGLCSEPALVFAAVNTRKANKMKDLLNSGVVLSALEPTAWAVHDPEFALVSFCLETATTAGCEQWGSGSCLLQGKGFSAVPMSAGQPINNREGRWPLINLLCQKTESQEFQQPSSAKATLM